MALIAICSGLLRDVTDLMQEGKKAWPWNYRAAVCAGGGKKSSGGPMGP